MNIGLYDADLMIYHSLPVNLELMKLSTYYKVNKRDIVSLTQSFSPDRYSKFIIRKDYYDGYFPKGLDKYDNIEYGGYAFSNDNYVPLQEEIEICKPDQYIYEKVFANPEYKNMQDWGKAISDRNSHFRLSLDGKTIWEDYKIPLRYNNLTKVIFNHDRILANIENSFEEISGILSDIPQSATGPLLGTKFPIQVNNFNDMKKWLSLRLMKFTRVQFNGILSDEQFVELYHNYSPLEVNRIIYNVDPPQSLSDEEKKQLILKIYYQTIFLWKNFKKISLSISQNFSLDRKWQKVLKYWEEMMFQERFLKSRKYTTFFDFCASLPENTLNSKGEYIPNRHEARELFAFVEKNNRELFEKFYTTYDIAEENGVIIDVSKGKYGNS